MKVSAIVALLAASTEAARLSQGDKSAAVGKVVKMLQGMLKQSQGDWESDKTAYNKFKCYCDENDEKKTKAISDAATAIDLLSNKLDQIQGASGSLSIETAQLKTDLADNEQSQAEAKALRGKESKSFKAEEQDLVAAIGQMDEALKLLSAIGADQTMASGADNAKFMGKYKKKALVGIRSSVEKAMVAASAFLEPEKKSQLEAFLQAPFTGTYSSQSGAIVGILKDMKSTFASNLETAKATEKVSAKSHGEFIKNKEDENTSLKKSYDDKQANLGTNDGDLATKKTQLQQFIKQKGEDEDFLAKVKVQCSDKKKEFDKRQLFAASENMALSQAIATLDNDVASEKFTAVDATSKGKTGLKLLQMSAHGDAPLRRTQAEQLLQTATAQQHSAQLGKLLMLLQGGNPFTVVLQQIGKMVSLADEEQKADDQQKGWCEKTNKKNKDNLDDTKDDLDKIAGEVTKLEQDITDPKTGLKKQVSDAEESLKTNVKNQGVETKTRRKENVEYQKDVSTMQDAIGLLSKADRVLTKYYSSLDNEQIGFLQDATPPKTFTGAYKGQNEAAKKVLGMLAFISSETTKEEKVAHDDELKSQHDYEDSMKSLTEGEASLQETIVKLNSSVASKEKELLAKREVSTNTEQEKIALERYIEKIKPGCEFTLKNYETRTKNRAAEKKALAGARTKLQGTPAFKAAQQKAKLAALGNCKSQCLKDKAHVSCLACLGDVSVPGYCAGHKGTKGC